jgi:DNA-binding transcriptional LysR family regulator
MDRLEAMSVVVAVAETGSFSAASRRLRTPVARVSRKVAELETRLGTEVFQRTSRRIALTDAGLSYIEACRRILEQVEDAEQEASGEYTTPKGDLSVTAPWGLGHMHLMPLALQFLDTHPEIALRLALTDRVINPIEEDIDVSIRIGPLPDSSMIASHIGSVRLVTCASPSYLAAYGTPMIPKDLGNHQCITVDGAMTPTSWQFGGVKQTMVVPIRSRLCVNTSEAAIQAAIAGAGLTRVMSYKMESAKISGALSIVLEAFEPEPLPVHIVYPQRKLMPLKLRAFITWITPRIKSRLTSQLNGAPKRSKI